MKKKLTQRLAQLIDSLPRGNKRSEVMDDYLNLKLSDCDMYFLTLENKYKDYE